MAEHTPGPWRVRDKQVDRDLGFDVSDWAEVMASSDGSHVASAYCRAEDVNQANARLISAAPELLAALELIRPMALGYAVANEVGSNVEYIRVADAAIAKARGNG
jgi:hypothetical protein